MPNPKLSTTTLFSEFLGPLGWTEELESFFTPFSPAFSTRGGFFARAYLMGLLLPGERKSIEPIAARLGVAYEPLQRLVNEAPWSDRDVLKPLRTSLRLRAADQERFLVFDDTGFPKQGKHSVGVQRQYSGTLGKIGNCQLAVGMAYGWGCSSSLEAAPVGWHLYLPTSWLSDPERRKKAGISPDHPFRSKWALALELLDEGIEDGLAPDFVLADGWYGDSADFRQALRDRKLPYGVGVNPKRCHVLDTSVPVGVPGRSRLRILDESAPTPVCELFDTLSNDEWVNVSWREGKPSLTARFHRRTIRVMQDGYPSHEQCELLLEIRSNGDRKAHLIWGMEGWSLTELVERVHRRWLVEQVFQQCKEELGLDHFEGRSYRGWNHHVTLVTLAFALLVLRRPATIESEKAPDRSPPPSACLNRGGGSTPPS